MQVQSQGLRVLYPCSKQPLQEQVHKVLKDNFLKMPKISKNVYHILGNFDNDEFDESGLNRQTKTTPN